MAKTATRRRPTLREMADRWDAKRDAIKRDYDTLQNYAAVGRLHQVSRQRVWQIINQEPRNAD